MTRRFACRAGAGMGMSIADVARHAGPYIDWMTMYRKFLALMCAALPLTAAHLDALQERAQRLLGLLVQARIELEVGQNLEAHVARLAAVLEGSDVPATEALDVVETGAGIPPEDLSAEAAREYARRIAHRRGTQDTDEEPRG